ncbi:hypothetical protein EYF80_001565 [Liparis tanakae]|uniref:Uncharacterized protein n=1 Tax=Liparis tanakae TaxID=230148 RepID=A0A4Z2JDQ2_9TELE|nr:hypothetical protein EYF80_001565 [Liparis tanakae]
MAAELAALLCMKALRVFSLHKCVIRQKGRIAWPEGNPSISQKPQLGTKGLHSEVSDTNTCLALQLCRGETK